MLYILSEIHCEQPRDIRNTEIMYNTDLYDDTANYTCTGDARFSDGTNRWGAYYVPTWEGFLMEAVGKGFSKEPTVEAFLMEPIGQP